MKPIVFWSLIFLTCLAVASWTSVYFMAQGAQHARTVYKQSADDLQKEIDTTAQKVRLSGLAKETQEERSALDARVNIELLTAARAIESAGQSVGVAVSITNAGVSDAGTPGAPLRAIDFSVEATGSYDALLKTLSALESLPFPSSVASFDMSITGDSEPKTKVPLWHLGAHVRLFTTASVSS